MAQLLYSKYIPKENWFVRKKQGVKENYLRLGYKVEEFSDKFYLVTRTPVLEMVFREGERDYVFEMMHEAQKRYCRLFEKDVISDESVKAFVASIVKGELKVHIYPDGTYKIE